MQLQTPLLQVFGEVQEPQFNVPPQPSLVEPQLLPWAAQEVGAQLQTLLLQVFGEVQEPQFKVPPQPSLMVPQVAP